MRRNSLEEQHDSFNIAFYVSALSGLVTARVLLCLPYRVFSHDVTAAILVSQNNETVTYTAFKKVTLLYLLYDCMIDYQ